MIAILTNEPRRDRVSAALIAMARRELQRSKPELCLPCFMLPDQSHFAAMSTEARVVSQSIRRVQPLPDLS